MGTWNLISLSHWMLWLSCTTVTIKLAVIVLSHGFSRVLVRGLILLGLLQLSLCCCQDVINTSVSMIKFLAPLNLLMAILVYTPGPVGPRVATWEPRYCHVLCGSKINVLLWSVVLTLLIWPPRCVIFSLEKDQIFVAETLPSTERSWRDCLQVHE